MLSHTWVYNLSYHPDRATLQGELAETRRSPCVGSSIECARQLKGGVCEGIGEEMRRTYHLLPITAKSRCMYLILVYQGDGCLLPSRELRTWLILDE
jgi:hypothetical protein